MIDNVKILEDLVADTVDRLQNLTRDRDRLGKEIHELRERQEALEREGLRSSGNSNAEQVWRGRQEQARSLLQEALVELHGE